ncbi:MAG: hypothetical protein A2X49_06120 [Lentisphaerae bacterium GWF2_52_8]|nr:MAG: hypothetical protein A2X49_06120 [Lentisphaerae bacterium GWF2_52_8]
MSNSITIEKSPLGETKIYRVMKGRQKVHEDYGLWICLAQSGSNSVIHQNPQPRHFEFYNISHLRKGHGWFWTPGGGKKNFSAGDGVMLCPGIVHDYNGIDRYEEDYICFAGPLADQLARAGILKPGILHIGPMRLLLPIIEMASDPSRNSQIKANIALQELLVKLYFENLQQGESKKINAIEKLLQELIRHPEKWWTVAEMAEMVNLSVNQFIRVFSQHTGLTPKKYIDTLKIKLAAEALRDFRQPLAAVAKKLGYRDPFHLSKRFKAITGLSPLEYRRQVP